MADADRFCPSCGTEVDADARFCPVCGTALADDEAPDAGLTMTQPELPAAPAWPEPEAAAPAEAELAAPGAEPQAQAEVAEPELHEPQPDEPEPSEVQPPRPEAAEPRSVPPAEVVAPELGQPDAPAAKPAAPPPAGTVAPPAAQPATAPAELPLTLPDTVSGWLVGIGSVLGAFALLPSLGDLLSLLLFLALLGVAATVFLADRIPDVPHQRVLVLAVLMLGLGIALERAAFTVRGLETILLLAMLTAAGGAMLVELGRDRPMPPPTSLRR